MAENPSLPLYTSIITLPDRPGTAAYADALQELPGYRCIDDRTVHLGSQVRYALLGALFDGSSPAPVTVRFAAGPGTGDTTATVSPRYFSRIISSRPEVADHRYRTAVMVRDALATVSPEHPTLVARMQATRREYERSQLSSFAVFIVTVLVVTGIITVLFGWPGWSWSMGIAVCVGGLVGAGITASANRPSAGYEPPLITLA